MVKSFFVFFFVLLLSSSSKAQAQECDGSPEICAEVISLRNSINKVKELEKKNIKEAEIKASEEENQKNEEKAIKAIAYAGAMAVALRILVSVLKSWKGYFQTDTQKAYLRLVLVLAGFATFVLSNFGFGLSWWQALILSGGGPGAMMVHELSKIALVLKGQKKYSEIDPDGDPSTEIPHEDK